MIPGVTAVGVYGVSVLPSEFDLSEPSTLITLLQAPFDKRVYLLEGLPYDRVTLSLINARAANVAYRTTNEDTLPNIQFEGRLITPYNMEVSVFAGGRLATHSFPSFGDVRIKNHDGKIDPWKRYLWGERQVVIKAGLTTFRYDQFGVVFTGTAKSVTWSWREIQLHTRDLQYKLQKNIQTNLYLGTGGLEGGVELNGKPKPSCYGQVREIEPVLVDPDNLIYQVRDGSVESITNLKDGGAPLTYDGDVADLYATTVISGHYKTDLAKGLFRINGPIESILTCDVQGDNSGTGYVSSSPHIIHRILTTKAGLADADLDLGSITAAHTANPSVNGYYTRLDSIHIEDVIDDLANSIGAFWTYTRQGLFRLVILSDPVDTTPVRVLMQRDFITESIMSLQVPPPAKTYKLGYKRFWTTQEGTSLADSVSAADRANYAEKYRYVTSPNPDTTVEDDYLDAIEPEEFTLIDNETDAQDESDRRMSLYGVERELLTVPLVIGLFIYQLGDVIAFGSDVYRYDLVGWKGVIVGMVEDVGDGTGPGAMVVTLWGRRLGTGIVADRVDGTEPFLVDDSGQVVMVD